MVSLWCTSPNTQLRASMPSIYRSSPAKRSKSGGGAPGSGGGISGGGGDVVTPNRLPGTVGMNSNRSFRFHVSYEWQLRHETRAKPVLHSTTISSAVCTSMLSIIYSRSTSSQAHHSTAQSTLHKAANQATAGQSGDKKRRDTLPTSDVFRVAFERNMME